MEKHVACYTNFRFWAGKRLEYNVHNFDIGSLMRKVEFSYQEDKYDLDIYKDGMLELHLKELDKDISDAINDGHIENGTIVDFQVIYLNYMNCIQVLLDSACIFHNLPRHYDLTEITKRDIVTSSYLNGVYAGGGCADRTTTFYHDLERFSIPKGSAILEIEYGDRPEIPKIAFDKLNRDLERASRDYNNIKLLANLAKSISEYKAYNYDVSLVLSWFIIEMYISKLWNDLVDSKNMTLEGGRRRIDSDRKNELKKFRVAARTSMLELFDKLDFDTLSKIDEVRDKRNKIVHLNKNFVCTAEHCRLAFELIQFIVQKQIGIDLKINTSYGFSF